MAGLHATHTGTRLHKRIFSIYIVQDAGVDEGVVQGRIEDGFLVVGATFHFDAAQVLLPGLFGRFPHIGEVEALLFGVQILAGVLYAHKGNANLNQQFFAGGQIVVVEPAANVVAAHLTRVLLVNLVLAGIGIPGGLGGHRTLFLPVTGSIRGLAHPQNKIKGEHGIAVIAESAHKLATLQFRGRYPPHRGTALVGEAFAQVQQDVAFSAREGVALQGRARGGGNFGKNAVEQLYGIVSGMRYFVLVLTAVDMIIHLQRTRSGHGKQAPQLRTAHAGQIHVGKAGDETVFGHIRGAPPAAVLVPGIQLRAHHVEGSHAHKAVGRHGAGVAGAKVGRADKRVHPLGLGVQVGGQ